VRSVTNADLAAGADRVLLIAPSAGLFRASPEAELAALGAERSLLVAPDEGARAAIGPNVLDPSRLAASLGAGVAQAGALAGAVAAVWT
jgi:NTE family protein